MNKHKHTPGPWAVERPYGEGGVYVSAPDTSLVARVYRKQDARLIAAAPKMLTALHLVIEHAGVLTGADWTVIRDAVDKAEGGEE